MMAGYDRQCNTCRQNQAANLAELAQLQREVQILTTRWQKYHEIELSHRTHLEDLQLRYGWVPTWSD